MIYRNFIRPLFFALDAERSHHLALSGLKTFRAFGGKRILQPLFEFEHPSLRVQALSLSFPNPVGLAAGFDKDAKYFQDLACLGFGFIEIGTVTFHPQLGNAKPRIKRLPKEGALWNHLGFNNDGARAVLARLKRTRLEVAVGINLGKSKIVPAEQAVKDYLSSFKLLHMFGDYVVLNVSSPNTPGLRSLQEKDKLDLLLREIGNHNEAKKPVLIKVSPDLALDDLDTVVEVGLKHNARGFIATNTTLSREGIQATLPVEGGVSGIPLRSRSTEIIRRIHKRAGKKICIIGCGGIFSAMDAYEKIKAGATLVQLYTGLVYEGPGMVRKIKEGLVDLLRRDGFNSISEAIGAGSRQPQNGAQPNVGASVS